MIASVRGLGAACAATAKNPADSARFGVWPTGSMSKNFE